MSSRYVFLFICLTIMFTNDYIGVNYTTNGDRRHHHHHYDERPNTGPNDARCVVWANSKLFFLLFISNTEIYC